jgi:hypothetical protein
VNVDQVNSVVIVVEVVLANVLDLVLENHVDGIGTAHQVNIVVILRKRVPSIVLENHVNRIETAHRVNPVVEIQVLVLRLVLENRVCGMSIANQEDIVVVLMIKNVSKLALTNRVTQTITVLWGNVVITIRNVKQEIASQKVYVSGILQSA